MRSPKNLTRSSRLIQAIALAGLCLVLAPGIARAQLTVHLTDGGGSTVNVTASGSFVNALTTTPAFGTNFALPNSNGNVWEEDADNNLGDIFAEPTHGQGDNDDLIFNSGGTIDFAIDSVTLLALNSIDLDPGPDGGGDDIELESNGPPVLFPALGGGEVISLDGTVSFELEVGTFSTVFVEGTYVSQIVTGFPEPVTFIVGPIPEPGIAAYLAMAAAVILFRRPRRRARAQGRA